MSDQLYSVILVSLIILFKESADSSKYIFHINIILLLLFLLFILINIILNIHIFTQYNYVWTIYSLFCIGL